MSPRFLTVCLSPSIQKTIRLSSLSLDRVNRAYEVLTDASGKGVNVARVLTQLGEEVRHLTHLGSQFREFLRMLTRDQIAVEWEDSGSVMRTCLTLVDDFAGTTTELIEPSQAVAEGTEQRIMRLFQNIVYQYDWILISGSRCPGYSDRIIPQMVSIAKDVGRKVILDCRGEDLVNSLPHGPDYIKPNREEFIQTFFTDQDNGDLSASDMQKMIKMKMTELYKRNHVLTVLTDGDSPLVYMEEGKMRKAQPDTVKAVNGTGSGDAFTAGMASALASGASMKEAVIKGMECGTSNARLFRPGVIK